MKKNYFKLNIILLNIITITVMTSNSWACSVCFYGEADDPMNKGLRAGIIALFVVLVLVLGLLAKFFLGVRKRSILLAKGQL